VKAKEVAMEDNAPSYPAVRSIPIDWICPSQHQARKDFDPDKLKGLAESLKQEGQLQPIMVRPASPASEPGAGLRTRDSGPSYEIILGERRWRAARLLGWPSIEAKVITTVSEAEAAAKGMVENVQRERLNPIEEAEGFSDLNRLDPIYWTQDKIAEVSGKDRTYVTRSIGLLGLPEAVKDYVRRRTLSRSHAIELLALPTPELQLKFANKIILDGLSLKDARNLIASAIGKLKHGFGKGSRKHQDGAKKASSEVPSEPDPLASLWPQVVSGDIAQNLNVAYQGGNVWDLQWTAPADFHGSAQDLQAQLAQCFLRLGQRLQQTGAETPSQRPDPREP
jgi:ParB/RepB/Spo0J family partition protein